MRSIAAACAVLLTVPALAVVGVTSAHAAECTIRGTSGDDRLVGTGGSDVVCGFGGEDVLIGGGDTDLLLGGGGADVLRGGPGSDVLQGGAGSDTVSYAGTTASVTADLDGRADDGAKGERDRIASTENLVGGSGSDTLVGDAGDNTLVGGAGPDDLSGGGGGDELTGAKGDDEITGGSGPDQLNGGPQDDLLVGGGGIDDLDGGTGVNYCDATEGEESSSSCRYDDRGPMISELTTSKSSYTPGDELVVEMRVTDAVGVAYAAVGLSVEGRGYDDCGWQMNRVSGSSQDGRWRLTCTVPTNIRNGVYEVHPYARDAMGNWTNMNGQNLIDLRGSFEVVGGSDDSSGPEIVSVSTDRTSYAPGDELVVRMHAREAGEVEYAAVSLRVGGVQYDDCGYHMTRISGTAQDGVWELRCVVPTTMRSGTYEVYPYARDASGNWTNMNGQNPIDLRGSFEVVGGSDDSAGPEIVSVSTDRASYAPGDELVVRMHARDVSGVEYAAVSLRVGGVQYDDCGWQMTRISGTAQDGVWELRCWVSVNMRAGRYEVYPYARDASANWTNMNGQNLIALRAYFEVLP